MFVNKYLDIIPSVASHTTLHEKISGVAEVQHISLSMMLRDVSFQVVLACIPLLAQVTCSHMLLEPMDGLSVALSVRLCRFWCLCSLSVALSVRSCRFWCLCSLSVALSVRSCRFWVSLLLVGCALGALVPRLVSLLLVGCALGALVPLLVSLFFVGRAHVSSPIKNDTNYGRQLSHRLTNCSDDRLMTRRASFSCRRFSSVRLARCARFHSFARLRFSSTSSFGPGGRPMTPTTWFFKPRWRPATRFLSFSAFGFSVFHF